MRELNAVDGGTNPVNEGLPRFLEASVAMVVEVAWGGDGWRTSGMVRNRERLSGSATWVYRNTELSNDFLRPTLY